MKTKSPTIAILLLGGVGSRFGGTTPKQYIEIGGEPLMAYPLISLQRSDCIDKILLVVAKEHETKALEIAKSKEIDKLIGTAPAGKSREESVQNALLTLLNLGVSEDAIVLIHDGDRPNLNLDLIERNVVAARTNGAAITAIRSSDSIMMSKDGKSVSTYIPREEIYRVQTPQTFRLETIHKAIERQGIDFTDDGSIVIKDGGSVQIVEGYEANIKITTKEDAEAFLAMKGESNG